MSQCTKSKIIGRLSFLTCLALASACTDDGANDDSDTGDDAGSEGGDGPGDVEVSVYGAFAEEGIPAAMVSDDWSLEFVRFEVALRGIEVAGQKLADPELLNLAEPSAGKGHVLGKLTAPAGSYADAKFTIAQLHVIGSARQGDTRKSFDWTFDAPVAYGACEVSTEIEEGTTTHLQINLHPERFLHDSAVSEAPSVAFGPLAAADTNGDSTISKEELLMGSLGTLDPGAATASDLWAWLVLLSRGAAGVGDGRCTGSAVP